MITYYLVCLLLLGIAYGGYRYWRRGIDEDLRIGAEVEFEQLQRTDQKLLGDLTLEGFSPIYHRAHFPRFPSYLLVTVAIFLLATPIVLGISNGIAVLFLNEGWVPQSQEAATQIYLDSDGASIIRRTDPETLAYILQGWAGFYLFFSMLGFWIAVVWFTMRRYHQREPGTLAEEVRRAR